MINLNVPILGEGWLNYADMRPVDAGHYLLAKHIGDTWAICIGYYNKEEEEFYFEPNCKYSLVKDVEFWHFIPDLPDLEEDDEE